MEAARPAPAAAAPAVSTTLSYLPVGLFGAVMGLEAASDEEAAGYQDVLSSYAAK